MSSRDSSLTDTVMLVTSPTRKSPGSSPVIVGGLSETSVSTPRKKSPNMTLPIIKKANVKLRTCSLFIQLPRILNLKSQLAFFLCAPRMHMFSKNSLIR